MYIKNEEFLMASQHKYLHMLEKEEIPGKIFAVFQACFKGFFILSIFSIFCLLQPLPVKLWCYIFLPPN